MKLFLSLEQMKLITHLMLQILSCRSPWGEDPLLPRQGFLLRWPRDDHWVPLQLVRSRVAQPQAPGQAQGKHKKENPPTSKFN